MKLKGQKVKGKGTSRRFALLLSLLIFASVSVVKAQEPQQQPTPPQAPKKSNERAAPPVAQTKKKPEPFDGATVAKMAEQCVTLETESGAIVIEMLAEAAPETARNFLNLVSTGSFDTITFSRVVKGFVIQGGNLSTSERWGSADKGEELLERARRKILDEPNYIKHVRGIVSMARPETPNGASTHFFILVSEEEPTLDNKFAAFGRVIKGMETVDAINNMQTEGDKPVKPVRLTRATTAPCVK
ncbi:MAG TPA: peptidylprolyl isomerase [Pyrinomonadaceae bacterium]|jgi:cyclophilin family peptidyl-prolyl cis-trans isomerase